jgi:hypothetical protein
LTGVPRNTEGGYARRKGEPMISISLQIAAIAAVAVYLVRWRAGLRRRNAQSWDSLVARLQPEWSARELSDPWLWDKQPDAGPITKWKRMRNAHGLKTMYHNAGVMLEMADYADRNSDSFNCEFLADLRAEAMQIRISVLRTLAGYAFNQVNESICVQALRAESAYAEMALRVTEFLQASAPDILPEFVAAM